ncbi:MAG: M17 family peptidase N-terminal domain-containing protein [Acidobacteriota bacterium]
MRRKNDRLFTSAFELRLGLRPLILSFILFLIALAGPSTVFAQQTALEVKSSAVGTSAILGRVDGVIIEAIVQGPSTEDTPLQVACVFEYTEGDIFSSPPALPKELNGMLHLDMALNGLITDLRKSGKFEGHAFETILLTPRSGLIGAKKLLLIGLGDRTKFNPELMISVGKVAMRESLRLGVSSFAFGSDLKDAGVDSPTALVAGNVVKGFFAAYRTENYLKEKDLASHKPLTKVTMLAGPAFFTTAAAGIKDVIDEIGK